VASNQPQTSVDAGAHATRGAARDAVSAQHDRFGGIKWGAAFFGWLSANGLAVILLAILSAAGVAFGLTQASSADQATNQATQNADTIGIAGGIALLVVLFLAYLAGGYVAGRMARFDGVRQGLAVWVIGLLVVIVLAIVGAVLGAQYNVLSQLNLPNIPISGGTLTTGGIVAGIAALLITLLGAILGGKLGTHYHRKIDRVGFDA
jgi:amino acid transporter